MNMKAKCPHCANNPVPGCEHCKDGFLEIKFESGYRYARECIKCGEGNGMLISDNPGLNGTIEEDEYCNCSTCKSKMKYVLIGYISDEPEEVD